TPSQRSASPVAIAGCPTSPAHSPAPSVGRRPLSASSTKHSAPQFFPSTRPTLVAPMFFEPCCRMSTPLARAMRSPNGIEPHTNESTSSVGPLPSPGQPVVRARHQRAPHVLLAHRCVDVQVPDRVRLDHRQVPLAYFGVELAPLGLHAVQQRAQARRGRALV